jgi:hypothetical protein
VVDSNGDGNLDIYSGTTVLGAPWWYRDTWLGNGDGTFGSVTIVKWGHKANF